MFPGQQHEQEDGASDGVRPVRDFDVARRIENGDAAVDAAPRRQMAARVKHRGEERGGVRGGERRQQREAIEEDEELEEARAAPAVRDEEGELVARRCEVVLADARLARRKVVRAARHDLAQRDGALHKGGPPDRVRHLRCCRPLQAAIGEAGAVVAARRPLRRARAAARPVRARRLEAAAGTPNHLVPRRLGARVDGQERPPEQA